LDFVACPPIDPTPSNQPQYRQDNDKKRALEEIDFTHAPDTARAAKGSRLCNAVEDLPKFRNYQEQQWQVQYQQLLEYKTTHGHCCVPNEYKPNPVLGRWVSTSDAFFNGVLFSLNDFTDPQLLFPFCRSNAKGINTS
jgi:hypothetical protein